MRKYKLFNWKSLKIEKYAENDVTIHRFTIPKGYRSVPYQTYIEMIYKSIQKYVEHNNSSNKPNYYIFVVDDKIKRYDLAHIYEIVCSSFTKVMTTNKPRTDRERRLGIGEIDKTICLNFINSKKWLNNENICEIVGMEVVGLRKLWKKRMVK